MKTKDLFAGCSVTVMPHEDGWGVSLNTLDLSTVLMRSRSDLAAALEVVHQWMLMLCDDTDVAEDDATTAALNLLRETIAKLALGEKVPLPEQVKEDEMKTWFDREMGKSRHEGG